MRKFLTFIALLFIMSGCAPKMQKLLPICPGKKSAAEALAALQLQSQNMAPFYAKGKCRLQYYDNGKKRKENLDIKLLVKSSTEIYFQGDLSIVPKAVVLGSNENEFWLALRPKEISTYWWGRWSELDSSQSLLINPRTLLEALGIAEIDMQADWSLSNEGPFDILTKRRQGHVTQKIFIYCCDYTIRKIEYFDLNGQTLTSAELNEYKNVSGKFFISSRIKVTTFGRTKTDSISINLELGSIQQRQFSEKQSVFFKPVSMEGFKHIYRLVNGEWIEQLQ